MSINERLVEPQVFQNEISGNVSKYVASKDGNSGEGHLIFHACFQSGNLGRVDCISPFEYDLFVRPDTCNPSYRMWFNFTVQNSSDNQHVLFNVVNFSKTKSLYREGMTPFVKSTSRPKWQRIPSKNVYYYRCPEHARNYVMSFAFVFDCKEDVYQFAYCIPYTYHKLQNYLDGIEKLKLNYFTRELLCYSIQQRRVDLLTVTSPVNHKDGRKRRVIFFTARVHPGETPSSYVCQGIIDFLVSHHPIAQVLREHLVFMIVPMLNPDGVVLGNYRCSLMGFDLNRFWEEPTVWAHPTLAATKRLVEDLNEDSDITLDFYIDLHAHSTALNSFMYGNIYEDESRFEQHLVFPRLLGAAVEDFSFNSTSFNRDTIKAGTGRLTLDSSLSEQSNCYTLEVSFHGYVSKTSTFVSYNEEGYMKLGRNVVRTFLNYYKLHSLVAHRLNNFASQYSVKTRDNKKRSGVQLLPTRRRVESIVMNQQQQMLRRNSWVSAVNRRSIPENMPRSNTNVHLKFKHRNGGKE